MLTGFVCFNTGSCEEPFECANEILTSVEVEFFL